jgi:hypothetical protein
VTEVDPDPQDAERSTLGGRPEPSAGDPTEGGKRGQIGEAASITADEPADGSVLLPAGVAEPDAPPVADPGPDA